MRIPRAALLPQQGGIIHKVWRAHNRDFLLNSPEIKTLYLRAVKRAIDHRSVKAEVLIHAYCIMSNHVHSLILYQSGTDYLSRFMRIAHSCFGQHFNKLCKRMGPVAYDRPKTLLVQTSLWNQMRVHFYIESNPLRAGMVKNLKLYKFSSFSYYAWGVTNEFTGMLTVPQWYEGLASTPEKRQSKYRSLFDQYVREYRIRQPQMTHAHFIGDAHWINCEKERFKAELQRFLAKPEPPPALV